MPARPIPSAADRLWRLKIRLGWQPPRFIRRIRQNRLLTLPIAVVRAFGLRTGDRIDVEHVGDTLVIRKVASHPARMRRAGAVERMQEFMQMRLPVQKTGLKLKALIEEGRA